MHFKKIFVATYLGMQAMAVQAGPLYFSQTNYVSPRSEPERVTISNIEGSANQTILPLSVCGFLVPTAPYE